MLGSGIMLSLLKMLYHNSELRWVVLLRFNLLFFIVLCG